MARRMLSEGLGVTVWNRSPAAAEPLVASGAARAVELADVWARARVTMTFLADDEALERVYLAPGGLVETAPPGTVLVDMSTVSPSVSSRVADAARAREVHYVRCPVSGNPGVLAAGDLALIVSGDKAAVDAAAPVLEHVGAKTYYVGPEEEARVVKLAVNAMLAANAEMLAELITLCEATGIGRAALLDVVAGSAVGSPFVRYKTDGLLERRYDATFTTAMLVKDLHLAQDVGRAAGVPLPVTDVVAQLAVATCADGLGDFDFMALLPHLQALASRPSDLPVPHPDRR